MIVVTEPDNSLLIVRQPDHAVSSARMAQAWCRPDLIEPDMWPRFIEAVRRHDDGWAETEKLPPLDEQGRPLDFKTIHTTQHVRIWRRAVDLAARENAYVGLLVAQHARWLYTHVGRSGIEDKATAMRFTEELALRIDQTIRTLDGGTTSERDAVRPHHLSAARRLLTFFDHFSLALIGALPMLTRTEHPLAFGPRIEKLSITRTDANVQVTPWPFESGPWQLDVQATRLDQQQFTNPQKLALRIRQPKDKLVWTLNPG